MKKTNRLYRCSTLEWANLPYEEALHFRIAKAEEAKDYYREQSAQYSDVWSTKNHTKMGVLSRLYTDSQDAIDWNRKFINEIEEERKKQNEDSI